MHPFSLIEPLEDRIAPATLINSTTVTYQDTDGDSVVVKISKPLFVNEAVANSILKFTTGGITGSNATLQVLDTIDLVGVSAAKGMNISVTVQQKLGVGNGKANVGQILAATIDPETLQFSQNIDLGAVRVQGDLGRIDAGDNAPTPALLKLDVDSMTRAFGSNVLGPIVNFHVRGDFDGARFKMYGAEFGNINQLTIDGALRGSSNDTGGQIFFTGRIGTATIGSIVGGSGSSSGALVGTLFRASSIGNLHVLGSITGGNADAITGGAANGSGGVVAQRIGSVQVDGSITGGSGTESGLIFGKVAVGSVNIGGALTGGAGSGSGVVTSDSKIFSVAVGGDVTGGAGSNSGKILASASVRSVQIGGSLQGAGGTDSGEIFASVLGSVKVGKNLVGGTAGTSASPGNSGTIRALAVNSIVIGGSVLGGNFATIPDPNNAAQTIADTNHTANTSGAILVTGTLRSLSIGGDLKGGTGANTGQVITSHLLSADIGGDLQGSSGASSGLISAMSNGLPSGIGFLHIGGSVLGGTANNSGKIITDGVLKSGVIDGNLTGGTVNQANALFGSGYIEAGRIAKLSIGGNVTAGLNTGTGGSANSGAIRAATADIGSLTIDGDLQGRVSGSHPQIVSNVIISAVGQAFKVNATTDVAINFLNVGGNVTRTEILAGYDASTSTVAGANVNLAGNPRGNAINADAQINNIKIGMNLSASNIVAGATSGTDAFFGDTNDAKPADNTASDRPSILSKISSIIVLGQATGSANNAEHFGIVAQNVAAVTLGSSPATTVALTPGPSNDNVPISANFRVIEIASA